jgi:hypothetical protein
LEVAWSDQNSGGEDKGQVGMEIEGGRDVNLRKGGMGIGGIQ